MTGVLLLALLAAPAPREPWKHKYVDANGMRLHYVTQGKGQLMLFLHGFPEFWYAWKGLLPEFAKDHHAVALDMRGYNLSSKPEGVDQYAVPLLVEDIRAVAAKLGKAPKKKIVLVAHDWGGAVAWAFAIAHPEYVSKLVIINAPHPGVFGRELASNPAQQKASGYMLMFRSPQAEATLSANNYATLVQGVLGSSKAFTEEDKKAYIEAWSQKGALTGGLNYYRAARVGPPQPGTAAPEAAGELARLGTAVKVPTLVIWGEKDRALLTGNLEGLDKFVPDLRIKRIPEGSHWVVHEYPEVVIAHIREFLGK